MKHPPLNDSCHSLPPDARKKQRTANNREMSLEMGATQMRKQR